jgi:hypothetical protein
VTTRDPLKRAVRQRARVEEMERKMVAERAAYRRLLLEAHRSGYSLRELGRELDVSWQRVQELVRYASEEEASGVEPPS